MIASTEDEHPVLRFMREEMMRAERNIKPNKAGYAKYWIACLQRRCVQVAMLLPMAEA